MSATVANPFDLGGRVALVTGATRGIGNAIARRLALQGGRVVVCGRDAASCDAAAAEIVQAGGEAIGAVADLEDRAGMPALVERIEKAYGRIDILIANAAAVTHVGPMKGVSDEAFDRMFAANLKSYVWLCKLLLPGMAARRDGAIVLIGSISGLVGERSLGIYGLSKAAQIQLVRNIAVEYGLHNVRANAIAPGLIRTDMSKALWSNPQTLEGIVSAYPLKRIGEPEDIAGVAAFLASPAAAFMTGQTLVVDGGGLIGRGTPI